MKNVLIACEFSATVRDAFIRRGFNAWSVDLIDTEGRAGNHHVGDALKVARTGYVSGVNVFTGKVGDFFYKWDLMIAHPPCRYLCNSGALRLYRDGKKINGIDPERWRNMVAAAEFFRDLLNVSIERIAVENPVMHGYAKEIIGVSHSQIIQPYDFGADASKATCLWLRNLPVLVATKYVQPRIVGGKKRWANQTDGGWNRLAPSPTRSADRARTYPGIAEAFVDQWGKLL